MFKACRLQDTATERKTQIPWYQGDYPPSNKNQPQYLREKAVEIANEIIEEGWPLRPVKKNARQYFKDHSEENQLKRVDMCSAVIKLMPMTRKVKRLRSVIIPVRFTIT